MHERLRTTEGRREDFGILAVGVMLVLMGLLAFPLAHWRSIQASIRINHEFAKARAATRHRPITWKHVRETKIPPGGGPIVISSKPPSDLALALAEVSQTQFQENLVLIVDGEGSAARTIP